MSPSPAPAADAEPAHLTVTRTIDAPRERVFRAWTDPGDLGRWFRPDPTFTIPVAEVELREGGRYRLEIQPTEGDPYVVVGVYRQVRPPERLVFTWHWESAGEDDPETLVTVELHERDGATEVVLVHERFTTAEQRDHHRSGWQACLESLETTLAAEASAA